MRKGLFSFQEKTAAVSTSRVRNLAMGQVLTDNLITGCFTHKGREWHLSKY
jgi:hypothetical protein